MTQSRKRTTPPIPNENTTQKRIQGHRGIIIHAKQMRSLISFELMVTLLLVAFAAIVTITVQVMITSTQVTINQTHANIREYQRLQFAVRSQLTDQYTSYEIERIAIERLGMLFPDPSQIIGVSIDRQGTVMLNIFDDFYEEENFFLQDIWSFISGLLNRVFGG